MSESYATPAGPLRAVVEELVRAEVRDVVICPGSRSTPLALALRAAPELRCWVHLDERAGAFFALGAARASRRPTAILATSGTAVVNFAPAVAEARYGRVPLVLLTADRPPELQGVGASQTIDQVDLYGRHAKWFAQLPVPEASAEVMVEIRNAVRRAVDVATMAPAGPVQLNVPFREPLLPQGSLARSEEILESRAPDPGLLPEAREVERVAASISGARRPLIVCGPLDVPHVAAAVVRLADASGAPIVADGLSNLRSGSHDRSAVVAHHDVLLRSDAFRAAHLPDLVLRFGGRPTSKVLDRLLEGLDARQLLVDDGDGWNVPTGPELIKAAPVAYADALATVLGTSRTTADPEWLPGWLEADRVAAEALEAWFAKLDASFEGDVARSLDEALPEDAVVVAGNSMPVRDLEAFMPTSSTARRMLGNRGANGIDGLLSTALGAAVSQPHQVLAVVGDVSFLHDLNALVAARRLAIDATVVLVNNDGGGIFSFLSQASADLPEAGLPQYYEELFGTPHGTDFGALVTALGASHEVVDRDSLATSLKASTRRPGVDVLELRTDRVRNVALHQEAFEAVVRAIEIAA